MTAITEAYSLPAQREWMESAITAAIKNNREAVAVGTEKSAVVYCSDVKTCEERNRDAVRSSRCTVRPVANRKWD